MRELSRIIKSFEFSLAVAKSKLSTDQKKVNEIEQEVLNFIAGKQAELEKLDAGCHVVTVKKPT